MIDVLNQLREKRRWNEQTAVDLVDERRSSPAIHERREDAMEATREAIDLTASSHGAGPTHSARTSR